VLLSGDIADGKLTETRTWRRGKDRFLLSRHDLVRVQGSHVSVLNFSLPRGLPAGTYLRVAAVVSGALSRQVQTPLSVG
jgi:hypothetical protein